MKEKKRIVYVLLGSFLGFLGIHSYYAGNKLKALIQFICGIFLFLIPLALVNPHYLMYMFPFIISYFWALHDIRTHYTDVEDQPMIDEFRRVDDKKYVKKALVYGAGSLLIVAAIVFIAMRVGGFANTIVVFNPTDPLLIIFSIVGMIVAGYFIVQAIKA